MERTLMGSALSDSYDLRFVVTSGRGGVFTRAWDALLSPIRLRRAVADPRHTIVHAHMASRGSFYRKAFLLSCARRWGCATVVHLHGGGFEGFLSSSPSMATTKARKLFLSSDAVVVLTDAWADFVSDLLGDGPRVEPYVVSNPVEPPETESQGSHAATGGLRWASRDWQRYRRPARRDQQAPIAGNRR